MFVGGEFPVEAVAEGEKVSKWSGDSKNGEAGSKLRLLHPMLAFSTWLLVRR